MAGLTVPEEPLSLTRFTAGTRSLLEDDADSSTYAGLLEQRALQLQCEILAIRMRQNSLVALNRLPPEILCNIFISLVRKIAFDWAEKKKLSWLRVTHVCRHWRAVALEYAPLWSNFRYFAHPELTKLMLARSKKAPLTIEIYEFTQINPQCADVVREALSQTHRLRSVTLGYLSARVLQLPKILADATGAAPLLRRLILNNNEPKPQSLPPDFLLGGAPALEILDLSSFDVPWNRLPLPSGLTRLHLKDAITRPLPSELFGSLQGLPVLRDLCLRNYLPDPGVSSRVVLPALTTLAARDSWARVSELLDAIQIPGINHVEIMLSDLAHQHNAIESCIGKLKLIVQHTLKDLPPLSRFSMSDFDESDLGAVDAPTFEMDWDPASTTKAEDDDKESALKVILSFLRVKSIPLPNALASLNTHFHLSTVSELILEASGTLNKNTFVDVLAKLPNVEELTILSCSVFSLLKSLESDPSLSQKKKRGKRTKTIPPYFPALLTLTFNDVNFQVGALGYQTVDLLSKIIQKRPKPHKLECLDIQTCRSFGASSYERLKKALRNVDVEWDMEEDWSDDSDSDDFYDSDDSDGFGHFFMPPGFPMF